MRPDDTTPEPNTQHRGELTPPTRDASAQQAAVAKMTREQIDRIYEKQATKEQAQETSSNSTDTNSDPYHQTHHQQTSIDQKQWDHYHSSWQTYYQKYYEQYYVSAVQTASQTFQQHAEQLQKVHRDLAAEQVSNEGLSPDEAVDDLRSELLTKVQESAKKVRKSRHFIPAISGLCVLLVFAFLQYNSVIFSYAQAYVSPGNIDPQNIITDPNASLAVSKEPRIIVPRFNIDVPVAYKNTMGSTAEETHNKQMAAMRKGVAYFGARGFSAHPGEFGNFGIAGHSSNDITDSGAAKFVFAPLLKMKKGDIFYLNYQGTRYTYSVTTIKEVSPSGVTALNVGTKKAMATLITCTPLGSADKRLLIFGEQISPDPATAKQASTPSENDVSATQLTGKSPTVFERLFGVR